jgi:hypothetical protein
MGQEYFIKSSDLESKVRELLPSQGGLGAGFDLSASTQIVPIVDLTESAEGSNVRADLQTALSFKTATAFAVQNANTTLISNTGYYRVFGAVSSFTSNPLGAAQFILTDGATNKIIYGIQPGFNDSDNDFNVTPFDFNVFLAAGDSLICLSTVSAFRIQGATRQIADIDGNLIDP